jgi:hypothetical protein
MTKLHVLMDINEVRKISNENSIKSVMEAVYKVIDKIAKSGEFKKSITVPAFVYDPGSGIASTTEDINLKIVETLKEEGFVVEDYQHPIDPSPLILSISWEHPTKGRALDAYNMTMETNSRSIGEFIDAINEAMVGAANNGGFSVLMNMTDLNVYQRGAVLDRLVQAGYIYDYPGSTAKTEMLVRIRW